MFQFNGSIQEKHMKKKYRRPNYPVKHVIEMQKRRVNEVLGIKILGNFRKN